MFWQFVLTVASPQHPIYDEVVVPLPAWVDRDRAIAAARTVAQSVVGAGRVRLISYAAADNEDAVVWDSQRERATDTKLAIA